MLVLPERFQTRRIELRPITMEDAPPVFETYAQDPEVTRHLTWAPHVSIEETRAYIADCMAKPAEEARVYIMRGRQDGAFGCFHLRQIGPGALGCGYLLARPFWGGGLMTEVLSEVVRWAESEPLVSSIGAVCDVDNLTSARVMEKSGMSATGLRKAWLVHPNVSTEPRDCWSYRCDFERQGT